MPSERQGTTAFFLSLVLASAASAATVVHPEWVNTLQPSGRPGRELHLAEGGEALYRIVAPSGAAAEEKLAAEKLRDYLNEMTGARFALVEEGAGFEPAGREISVGQTRLLIESRPAGLQPDPGEDGYGVAVVGERLFIFGQTPEGTLNGVYRFLQEDLDCRWYAARYAPVIPQRPSLKVSPVVRTYRPVMEHWRHIYYADGSGDPEWVRANQVKSVKGEAWGFSHTYWQNAPLVPPPKYFAEHPEYYSLVGDKRTPRQLCMSNPAVEEIILNALLANKKQHPANRYYEVSPNDGRNYCECEACTAINEAAGGTEMGTLLRVINGIARKVEPIHPDVRITTLAYLDTVMPPTNAVPHKNVIISLATDSATWAWPHLYLSETPRPKFRDAMKAWNAVGATLRIWDYAIVFQYSIQPIMNVPVVSDNIRYYARHGAIGAFVQGTHLGDRNFGADRSLLRLWVWQQQLWNPSLDTRDLIGDFNHGFYGSAGEAMHAYDEFLWSTWERHHMNYLQDGNAKMRYDVLYNRRFLDEAFGLMEEAERLAGANQEIRRRIGLAKLPLQYLALNRGPEENPAGYRRMLEAFKRGTLSDVICWNYGWAGGPGCGPAGDTGTPNADYDHVPLGSFAWDGSAATCEVDLAGHEGLSLADLVDRWSGPGTGNAGIIIKADAASEASLRDRVSWGSAQREPAEHRPRLTIVYTPRDASERRRIVFRQGADNALVENYQGCEDYLLVHTHANDGHADYQTGAVGSLGWVNRNSRARTVMRWDLSALAGRYADIHAMTLTLHGDKSFGSGTAYVYAIRPANIGWKAGGRGRSIQYVENQFFKPDREPILAVWEGLADGTAAGDVTAVALGPTWRYRYDEADMGSSDRWYDPATADGDWTAIQPGDRITSAQRGDLWLRTHVAIPRDVPRNNNYLMYVPGVRGDVDVYFNGALGFERTARATGLSSAELADEPLVLGWERAMAPGQKTHIAIRVACPRGVDATWPAAYLVSTPARLAAPALEIVTAALKAKRLVRSSAPIPVVGSLSLPKQWTVFAPLDSSTPVPPAEVLRSVPQRLTIGERTYDRRIMTVSNHRLDLTPVLEAVKGRGAYVFIAFDVDMAQELTFGLGADWWFESWLDGEPLMDTLKHGNDAWPPSPSDYLKRVHAGAGRHVLAVRFLSGTGSSVLAVAGPDGLRAEAGP